MAAAAAATTTTTAAAKDVAPGSILCFGNPLLDMSVTLEDDALLKQFDLKPSDAILADEHGKHAPLFAHLQSHKTVEYIAGGSGQNTTRVAQWMLATPHACVYIGSIGKDENGKRLQSACEAAHVQTHYQITDDVATGMCGVLILHKDRSMVTDLKAANHYKLDHYLRADTQAIVDAARVVYIAGYFLTVSPDTAYKVAERCNAEGKTFMMNLAAPFLIEVPFFFERVEKLIHYADVVFANEHEAAALGKAKGWGDDLVEIATRLQKADKNGPNKTNRVVVFTHGEKPCVVVGEGGVAIATPAPARLAKDDIVDLNGAGDAFCGGFVAAYARAVAPAEAGKKKAVDIAECVAAGHWAASQIIRVSGTKLAGKASYFAASK